MARSERQKEKLLRLLEIFIADTDENVGVTTADIIKKLEGYGISAERKSIYDDLMTLSGMGYEIEKLPTRPASYTLASRPFSLTELKMLVDAVESSRFISKERSERLIAKLRRFAGKGASGELNRSVYIEDRVKTDNDGSLENIDVIHRATNRGAMLEFKYFDYTRKKEKIYRHDGRVYCVSPISLVFSEENYYLVALDSLDGVQKNFRVDKMDMLRLSEQASATAGVRFNPAEYSRKIFGMYGGREELVTLECRERLLGVIIDRFGKDVTLIPTDFGFKVSVRVMVSPTFFAWVMGFAKDMRIVSPVSVIDEIKDKIKELTELY